MRAARVRRSAALLAAPMLALAERDPVIGCASAPERVLNAASPYFDAKTLDLGRVLPPPPTNDSAITRTKSS